jgi:acyl-CoA synthetase (AMP-forming)/AMP-acid ligase II
MVVPDTEERITYGQLAERVGWLSAHLEAMLRQAPATAPIAICMANSPELLIAVLAIAHSGRVAMPINPGLNADLVAEHCTDTETCLVVVRGAEEAEAALRAAERLSLPSLVASLDPEKLEVLRSEVPRSADGLRTQRAEVGPDATALLLQTSGTTSKPKRVPLTHRNILAALEQLQQTYVLTSEDVSLLVMPLFHGHGLIGVALSTLYSGGCLVIPPRFSAHRFAAWANRYGPTWYSAVPTIHEILLMRDDLAAVTGLRVPTAWASRRGSSLLYGLRLRPPLPSGLFAPARYASLIRALQARFSGPDGSADDDVPTEAVPPSLRIQYQSQGDHLVIDQLDPGFDPDSDWRSIRRAIGRHAVTEMRMPLDHAATPEWCSRAEHEGFFFAGLVPSLTQRRDLICYRRLLAPPVPVIRYADAGAKALLDAILGDYQRVHGETIEALFEPGHAHEHHTRA